MTAISAKTFDQMVPQLLSDYQSITKGIPDKLSNFEREVEYRGRRVMLILGGVPAGVILGASFVFAGLVAVKIVAVSAVVYGVVLGIFIARELWLRTNAAISAERLNSQGNFIRNVTNILRAIESFKPKIKNAENTIPTLQTITRESASYAHAARLPNGVELSPYIPIQLYSMNDGEMTRHFENEVGSDTADTEYTFPAANLATIPALQLAQDFAMNDIRSNAIRLVGLIYLKRV